MNSIINFIISMMPYMLASVPVIILIRAAAYFVNKKNNIHTTALHEMGFALLFMFIVGLASQTIIPRLLIDSSGISFAKIYGASSFNFIPGRIITTSLNCMSHGDYNYFIINFLGNVGMFIPLGLMIPLLWRCSVKKTILTGFLSSLSIELIQIFLPRCTDIDDLWMNTLGAVIGCLIYVLINKLFPGFTEKCKTHEENKTHSEY